MSNILIVEDDSIQLTALSNIIKEYNREWSVYTAANFDSAIQILTNTTIHLFFLDIKFSQNLEEQNGIDLGVHIRSINHYINTPIIYITSYLEHIGNAINDIHCYGYLHKPYSAGDVVQCLNSVLDASLIQRKPLHLQDINGVYFRTYPDNILYITAHERRRVIQERNCKYTISGITMTDLLSLLPPYFIRCHKKYIINLHHITNYDRTDSTIEIAEVHLPLGRAYKSDFEERITSLE